MAFRFLLSLIITVTLSPGLFASELSDRMTFWRQQAFYCSPGSTARFPSKEEPPGVCDDGDMTLFNGLLCAAGEPAGCDGVKRAQDGAGRWWRSPRRIGMEYPSTDVSFSPDHTRGVLLYAATTGDAAALERYGDWIENNRPCLVPNPFGGCAVLGWPRLCRDDQVDKRCTFRPWTCVSFALASTRLSAPRLDVCGRVLRQLKIEVSNFFDKAEMYATGSALVNDPGFPMHLAAVDLFLLTKLNADPNIIKLAAQILVVREPKNPFFQFLAGAPAADVTDLVLDLCPSPEKPSARRFQWAWEREASEEAWLDSMYWDCIFMGRLLGES